MTLELVPDERQPTANDHAERSLLAAVLTGHPAAAETLEHLAPRDFYQPRHGALWEAMQAQHVGGERVSFAGLHVPPRAHDFIVTLVGMDAEPMLAPRYAAEVLDAAQRRRLTEVAAKIQHLAGSAVDALQATQDAAKAVEEVAETTTDDDSGLSATDLFAETMDELESDQVRRVDTGWRDLDSFTGGMRAGQLVIVGARPGYGKSVVAANLAAHAAKAGIGVHFASLEMRRTEVMSRLLADHCTVDLGHLQERSQMTEHDWERLRARGGDVRDWPLWVDDRPGQNATQLRARLRASARRMDLGLVVVDYLQIMRGLPGSAGMPREQVVGDTSQALKEMAKEFDVPVVALSQVNRGPADRKDPRPTMSDLRESGRIEADADQILLLHRPDLFDRDYPGAELEVQVAKNRNGPQGRTISLGFYGHYSRVAPQAYDPTRGPQ